MDIAHDQTGYWITGADPYFVDGAGPFTSYGPYRTKSEAVDDLRGLVRFERIHQKEHDHPTTAAAGVQYPIAPATNGSGPGDNRSPGPQPE